MAYYPPYEKLTLFKSVDVKYSNNTGVDNNEDAVDKLDHILKLLEMDLGFFDPDCELSDGYIHPAINTKKRLELLSQIRSCMLDLIIDILEEEDDGK